MVLTKLEDVINLEVMADTIKAGVERKPQIAPLAEVNDDLVGVPGYSLMFPKFAYDGAAEDVAEGEPIPESKLTASQTLVPIKKAGKSYPLSDEVVEGGQGDPVGKAIAFLERSIVDKIDKDLLESAKGTPQTAPRIDSVQALQNALNVFKHDGDYKITLVINATDASALQLDAGLRYLVGSQIGADRITTGVHGEILGVQVVSRRDLAEGEFFLIREGALVLAKKSEVQLEVERVASTQVNKLIVTQHYATYLYDDSGVVKSGARTSANATDE